MSRPLLKEPELLDLVHEPDRTTLDKVLLCLAVDHPVAVPVARIRSLAVSAGIPSAKKINIPDVLRKSRGKAANTGAGWKLAPRGVARVLEIRGAGPTAPATAASINLANHAKKITDPVIRAMAEEAVGCCSHGLYRAAVVFSWVTSVALLYRRVVNSHLADFNSEAVRRTAGSKNPWKAAKTEDDLALMNEDAFLDIAQHISLFGKSVKLRLKRALELRNGCGHPNSFAVGEAEVAAHIEALIQNVLRKFA